MLATTLLAIAFAADPAVLPTPFTADQIRDAMPTGAHIHIETHNEAGVGYLDWTVTEADAEHVVLRSIVTPEGGAALPPRELRTTWEELRTHAELPTAVSSRRPTKIQTPWGKLPGWRYKTRETDEQGLQVTTTMWFATAIPGPPVRMETATRGGDTWTFEQVERSPLPPGVGPVEAAPVPQS